MVILVIVLSNGDLDVLRVFGSTIIFDKDIHSIRVCIQKDHKQKGPIEQLRKQAFDYF